MPDDVVIRKVREPYGWLCNMYAVGVWPTAEHAFQALRFADTSEVRKLIMGEPSPMAGREVRDNPGAAEIEALRL
jgi:hypothetical protein